MNAIGIMVVSYQADYYVLCSKSEMKLKTLQALLVKWHGQFSTDRVNENGSNIYLWLTSVLILSL